MTFASDTGIDSSQYPYAGAIAEGWDVVGNANGGYLMALGARALAAAAERPHPISVTAHYLAPGRPGPITIAPQVIKAGRRLTTVRATLHSADKPLIELLGTFGDINSIEGPERIDAHAPDIPPVDQCPRVHHDPTVGFPPALMNHVDMRLHPEDAQFMMGVPSGDPLIRGWLRLPDDEPLDVYGLLLATDAFPPSVFNTKLPIAWSPTVELTAHIRAIPAPGWLRCRFSTRFISGGMMEEDCELWDSTGRLVAQSRQLALTPVARA